MPPSDNTPLLRTKLRRPPVAPDVVRREELHERLDAVLQRPLGLVVAPAGYGKTTLVSHWLEGCGRPGAWLSLDDADDDLETFLRYLLAAVQKAAPEAGRETLELLERGDEPPIEALSRHLAHDLDELDGLVIVLDDLHRIHSQPVLDLLDGVLAHPPAGAHLVATSRRDLPLSLVRMRALDRLVEIRLGELRFEESVTAAFLDNAVGGRLDAAAVRKVHERTEGWPVALRLAALALRKHPHDSTEFLDGLGGDPLSVQQYLVTELMAQQAPAMQSRLRETSILGRFCAPLCDALAGAGAADELDGESFVSRLEESGLPCVALGGRERRWLRYHHLFQGLLLDQLRALAAPEEISALRRRAAAWFEEQGLLEEAIGQLLESNDPSAAARLVARQRSWITEKEQWHRLDVWLRLFPARLIEESPELLMLQAWSRENRGHDREMAEALDRLEPLLETSPLDEATKERLSGEADVLRSLQHYRAGRGVPALERAEAALRRLPKSSAAERAYATILLGLSLQMVGEAGRAQEVVLRTLDGARGTGTFQGRVLMTLGFLHWIAGDLDVVAQTGVSLLDLARTHDLPETGTAGAYFQGIASYQLGELARAESLLACAAQGREVANSFYRTHATLALSLVQQARGREVDARHTASAFLGDLLERGVSAQVPVARALVAELALRQGRHSEAVKWARTFESGTSALHYGSYVPHLTAARAWLAEGTTAALDRANELLVRLNDFFSSIHNVRFTIEARALLALMHDARGDAEAARSLLGEAVKQAQPGGYIRLFVDLGPELARLLGSLELDEEGQRYVGRVLAAFVRPTGSPREDARPEARAGSHPALVEPLSERELEILGLFARKLSNKEIGSQLFISPGTVKRHAENIYQKLGTHGRRQAVAEAQRLGILPGG